MNAQRERGQALVEYVLLILMIAGMTTLLFALMPRALDALETPLKKGFAATYKYGDPKGCGYSDPEIPGCSSTPERHPKYAAGGNFRMFGRGK